MTLIQGVVGALAVLTVVLVGTLVLRPALTAGRPGKALAFVAMFVLPIGVTALGLAAHLDHAKTTEFCLSCHEMEPYGESLRVDDPARLAAVHFQNSLVPRERACYDCHTDYTMFGDVRAKLNGLRHVWVHYAGTVPDEIELYRPYRNRECLRCHAGARRFEEDELHADVRAELAADEISCLECHEPVHATGELEGLPRWEGAP